MEECVVIGAVPCFGNYKKENIKAVIYQPIDKVIAKFKTHPLASGLAHFGEKFDEYSYWIHKADTGQGVDLYPWRRYLLNMFESQFVLFRRCTMRWMTMRRRTRRFWWLTIR